MAKFVRYGPPDRYGMPEAGFCASSFAIVRSGRKLLLGVAKPHPRWEAEWAPNFAVYTPEERAEEFRLWRFPAAYLYEGESPGDCLDRVMGDMLQAKRWTVIRHTDHGFYDPSTWYPGRMHYDLCFVYDVKLAKAPAVPPWFARLEYVDPKTLRGDDFGSAMGDLAKALRLIQNKSKEARRRGSGQEEQSPFAAVGRSASGLLDRAEREPQVVPEDHDCVVPEHEHDRAREPQDMGKDHCVHLRSLGISLAPLLGAPSDDLPSR